MALVFFALLPALTERVGAGMDWSEVAAVRLVALPAILLTGRPYAIWRDAALRRAPGA